MRPTDTPEQVADHLEWLQSEFERLSQELAMAEVQVLRLNYLVTKTQELLRLLAVHRG